MKRNMELIHAILKAYEEAPITAIPASPAVLSCDSLQIAAKVKSKAKIDDIEYQLHFNLIMESGFLVGTPVGHRLTWKGYDFLDSFRPGTGGEVHSGSYSWG